MVVEWQINEQNRQKTRQMKDRKKNWDSDSGSKRDGKRSQLTTRFLFFIWVLVMVSAFASLVFELIFQ